MGKNFFLKKSNYTIFFILFLARQVQGTTELRSEFQLKFDVLDSLQSVFYEDMPLMPNGVSDTKNKDGIIEEGITTINIFKTSLCLILGPQ